MNSSTECASHRWNAGGWFGCAIGSCAWMVIVGGFLVGFGQADLAVIPLVCIAVTMMAAVVIWQRSAGLKFISGVMSLIGVLAFTIPIAWLTTAAFANAQALKSMNWPASPIVTAVVLFAAPAAGVWVAWTESRRQSAAGSQ